MILNNLLRKIENDFSEKRELIFVHYEYNFINLFSTISENKKYEDRIIDKKLLERKKIELHFHNMLMHQLFSCLQEIKYYSDVNIFDTRRLVAVSSDCISLIQLLIRDKIYVNVYFRSSDFDGALPIDLIFINSLPYELYNHLKRSKHLPSYQEINENVLKCLAEKEVKIGLTFGSLHRTL